MLSPTSIYWIKIYPIILLLQKVFSVHFLCDNHQENQCTLKIPGSYGVSAVSEVFNCYNVLHLNIPVSVEGCAAARAAIRAAEIQAKATRSAGTQGIVSGLMALVAGSLAFGAAIYESFRLKKIELSKRKAYSVHISAIFTACILEIRELEIYLKNLHDFFKGDLLARVIPVPPEIRVTNLDLCRKILSADKWEELGNLPEDSIKQCVKIGQNINDFIENFVVIRDKIIEIKNHIAIDGSKYYEKIRENLEENLIDTSNIISESNYIIDEMNNFITKTEC